MIYSLYRRDAIRDRQDHIISHILRDGAERADNLRLTDQSFPVAGPVALPQRAGCFGVVSGLDMLRRTY